MWFPMDQPWYQQENAAQVKALKDRYATYDWGREDPLPAFNLPYEEWFTALPMNFHDDLHTKPDVHRRFMHEMSRSNGHLDPNDHAKWIRLLDYYLKLHQMSDEHYQFANQDLKFNHFIKKWRYPGSLCVPLLLDLDDRLVQPHINKETFTWTKFENNELATEFVTLVPLRQTRFWLEKEQ